MQLICPVPSVTVPDPVVPDPFTVTVKLNVSAELARKTSSSAFESLETRLSAKEMKLTVLPSPLMEGATLLPSAGGGADPTGLLTRSV